MESRAPTRNQRCVSQEVRLNPTPRLLLPLLEIIREHGGSRIQIVAHSMGGLVAFAALNRRPDLVHSVLFAGVPFGHTLSFLEDMHAGMATGLNKRALSPEVLYTFTPHIAFSHGTAITPVW